MAERIAHNVRFSSAVLALGLGLVPLRLQPGGSENGRDRFRAVRLEDVEHRLLLGYEHRVEVPNELARSRCVIDRVCGDAAAAITGQSISVSGGEVT